MAIQKTHKTLAAVAAIAVSAAAPAHAEGLELGGYITPEGFYDTDGYSSLNFDVEMTLGYRNGPLYVGIGQYIDIFIDSFDEVFEPFDPYIMVGYGDFLVSYGQLQGAGNLFPEDYFDMTDTTSHSDNTVRIDYAPGADSVIVQHVALSYDFDDDNFHDAIEFGILLAAAGYDVGLGYEGDDRELGLILARDFRDLRLHGAVFHDFDDNDLEIGLSAFQTFGEIDLGAHVQFDPDNSNGALDTVAVIAYYETQIGTLSGQVRHELSDCCPTSIVELGLDIPFGINAPSSQFRRDTAENTRRFGF